MKKSKNESIEICPMSRLGIENLNISDKPSNEITRKKLPPLENIPVGLQVPRGTCWRSQRSREATSEYNDIIVGIQKLSMTELESDNSSFYIKKLKQVKELYPDILVKNTIESKFIIKSRNILISKNEVYISLIDKKINYILKDIPYLLIFTKSKKLGIYRVYFCQNFPFNYEYTSEPQYMDELCELYPKHKNFFIAVGNHANDSWVALKPFRNKGVIYSSYRINGKPYKALDPIPCRSKKFIFVKL